MNRRSLPEGPSIFLQADPHRGQGPLIQERDEDFSSAPGCSDEGDPDGQPSFRGVAPATSTRPSAESCGLKGARKRMSKTALRAGATPLHLPVTPKWPETWFYSEPGNLLRAHLLSRLIYSGGRHLVFVRYKPNHFIADEWVYNGADIDGARVVWARDMGTERNEELVRYFKDRHAWLLEADERPPRLLAYRDQTNGQTKPMPSETETTDRPPARAIIPSRAQTQRGL